MTSVRCCAPRLETSCFFHGFPLIRQLLSLCTIWGWVKTYDYHIWRHNHPLRTIFGIIFGLPHYHICTALPYLDYYFFLNNVSKLTSLDKRNRTAEERELWGQQGLLRVDSSCSSTQIYIRNTKPCGILLNTFEVEIMLDLG